MRLAGDQMICFFLDNDRHARGRLQKDLFERLSDDNDTVLGDHDVKPDIPITKVKSNALPI